MEENKQAKRSYRRNKPVTKSKVYAIRLDIDLVDFVREQPNMSKFINELIRKEKENTQKYESKAKIISDVTLWIWKVTTGWILPAMCNMPYQKQKPMQQ